MSRVCETVKKLLSAGYRIVDKDAMMAAARAKRVVNFQPNPRYKELQDPLFYSGGRHFELNQRAEWPMAPQELCEFTRKLFIALRRNNLPAYVHTCWRSPELQAELVEKGHSKLKDGPHLRSAAVDIVHATYNWNAPKVFWDTVGQFGKDIIRANGYGIEWGGGWNFYDPAHWQLKNWRDLPRLSARALFDQETGEVITWKRSPFSKEISTPYIGDENYFAYLERHGRTWKTTNINRKG